MSKLRIALGDLSYLNEDNAQNLYVPINVGYLAAYAKSIFRGEIDVRIYKDPHKLLREAEDWRPHLVGLSLYYWQEALDAAVVRGLRKRVPNVEIVMGGPNIDTNPVERMRVQAKFPGVRAVIPNEGEEAFASTIAWMLNGRSDGVDRSLRGDFPQLGAGLSTDLGTVPSPYLDGTLDEFVDAGLPYQPMIQTSRLCPYTCSFCVSGKNRGKLRAFPLDQVQDEIDFIAERFRDRPEHCLYIVDENFGILDRDVSVAHMLAESRSRHGFPRRLFYYNDKRFTSISRQIHEIVGDMCHHGVCLSLQSDNPETLKAIKRRNLTDEQIKDAIAWAHGRGLKVSTELIFGLPGETLESFLALLDKCGRLGFDAIQCYNLIVFDGIEMARRSYREQHRMQTKQRTIHAHRCEIDGEAVVEHEEVVTKTDSFNEMHYRIVRTINVWFHAIFALGIGRDAVRAHIERGGSLIDVVTRLYFIGTDPRHKHFVEDLHWAIKDELSEGDIEQPKIQPTFAARLAREGWLDAAIHECIAASRVRA